MTSLLWEKCQEFSTLLPPPLKKTPKPVVCIVLFLTTSCSLLEMQMQYMVVVRIPSIRLVGGFYLSLSIPNKHTRCKSLVLIARVLCCGNAMSLLMLYFRFVFVKPMVSALQFADHKMNAIASKQQDISKHKIFLTRSFSLFQLTAFCECSDFWRRFSSLK